MKSHCQVVFRKALTSNVIFPTKGDYSLLSSKRDVKNASSQVYSIQTSFIIPISEVFSYPNTLHFPPPEMARFISLIRKCQTQPFTKATIQSIASALCWCPKTASKLNFTVRKPESLTLYLHFLHGLVPSSSEWAENHSGAKSVLMHPTSRAAGWPKTVPGASSYSAWLCLPIFITQLQKSCKSKCCRVHSAHLCFPRKSSRWPPGSPVLVSFID